MINQGSVHLSKMLRIMTHNFIPAKFTEHKFGFLPSKLSNFTALTVMPMYLNTCPGGYRMHSSISMEVSLAKLYNSYYDSAIYCFTSCYIYAHETKSSHVMKNQLKEHAVSKQSPST